MIFFTQRWDPKISATPDQSGFVSNTNEGVLHIP